MCVCVVKKRGIEYSREHLKLRVRFAFVRKCRMQRRSTLFLLFSFREREREKHFLPIRILLDFGCQQPLSLLFIYFFFSSILRKHSNFFT